MDGIEAARRIRKRLGKDITIIVLTSYDYSEIEDEARRAGVDAFITKPLFRSRLAATLKDVVSGRPERSAKDYLKGFEEADYSDKRVLIVEDNDLNREIAVEIVGMTGVRIDTAENGHRLIGIISHVEEVKGRIPHRIEVTKERTGGSIAKIR